MDCEPLFLPSVGIISPVSGSILSIRVLLALEHFFFVVVRFGVINIGNTRSFIELFYYCHKNTFLVVMR